MMMLMMTMMMTRILVTHVGVYHTNVPQHAGLLTSSVQVEGDADCSRWPPMAGLGAACGWPTGRLWLAP
eukprot:11198707-Lingulodinium_polyedra.AAC.1